MNGFTQLPFVLSLSKGLFSVSMLNMQRPCHEGRMGQKLMLAEAVMLFSVYSAVGSFESRW